MTDLQQVRAARAGLLRAVEPPGAGLVAFIAAVGPVEAWHRILRGRIPETVPRSVIARTAEHSAIELDRLAAQDLRRAGDHGARLLIPEDPEWPAGALIACATAGALHLAAPIGLYVRGGLPDGPAGVVTLVGSRSATPYGRRIATELAADLVRAGCHIVSGAAFGIDAAAHQGALFAGGPRSTSAVLACGIDRAYPAAHRRLIDEIASNGAVISEYPPGTAPHKHRFLARNRLIAALSAVTVVVEAGRRSGSISTANAAAALNRIVMAVPGPVTSAMSAGCHDLLRADVPALLATDARDVLGAAGRGIWMPDPLPTRPTDVLSGELAKVYEALPARGTITVTEISTDAGVVGNDALAAMAELEMMGFADRVGSGWKRATGNLSGSP